MGPDLNKHFIQGNLGQDPELRYTQAGQAVLNMRLATNEQWVDQPTGDLREKTEWHTVVVWGKRAEGLNKVLKKGMRLFVEGRGQTRTYDAKIPGVEGQTYKRAVYEIVAADVKIQPTRRRDDEKAAADADEAAAAEPSPDETATPAEPVASSEEAASDIPF
jgi:single-strand DNA-binding protein